MLLSVVVLIVLPNRFLIFHLIAHDFFLIQSASLSQLDQLFTKYRDKKNKIMPDLLQTSIAIRQKRKRKETFNVEFMQFINYTGAKKLYE